MSKQHISIAVCGHVDSGKSTTTGHLLYKLGKVNQRELQKLKDEAELKGKGSFFYAYVTDTSKSERDRGVTENCTTKEFFVDNYHYTIVDAPGHKDYVKNMINGSSCCDVALLMVPADGNFITAIRKGDRKSNEVEGQTRQHSMLINLVGIKQLIIGVNKMDEGTVQYKQDRFEEIKNEMQDMLIKVGWPKAFVQNNIPIIPISGWNGDNLIEKSTNMSWWEGCEVKNLRGETVKCTTLVDCFNNYVCEPERLTEVPLRIPISGVYNIKGVGDVITGRIEQGKLNPGEKVVFVPSHTDKQACGGKVFSIEMHHKTLPQALAGHNIGMNVKGLDKNNMPKRGDVMVLEKDTTLKICNKFTALVQVIDHPGELKVGYSPIGSVRTGESPCKIVAINWKKGKSTSNVKVDAPANLVAGDTAEIVFEPTKSFVVEEYAKCQGLSRIGFFEGFSVVMLGKVIQVE